MVEYRTYVTKVLDRSGIASFAVVCIALLIEPLAHATDNSPTKPAETLYMQLTQVGLDPASGELADGVEAQAERALRNLQAVLDAAGLGLDDVVKTTIFLTDVGDFATINAVYAKFMPEPPPARSTVGIAALPRGALVEIEAIAHV